MKLAYEPPTDWPTAETFVRSAEKLLVLPSKYRAEIIMSINSVQPKELAALLESVEQIELIDVRTPAEFQEVHVQSAFNIPLNKLDPEALLRSQDALGLCPQE